MAQHILAYMNMYIATCTLEYEVKQVSACMVKRVYVYIYNTISCEHYPPHVHTHAHAD